jgi:aldehyde dehydrogenase family 7 protein A1
MVHAKAEWAKLPMPARGDIVRQIGESFRAKKEPLGRLISLEMGKILSEGLGEVQEVIDVCDMACGLSRTIGGSVLNSERPEHFMMEVWNPLGIVGVITAFNFPCAVFGWNAAIAFICGNLVVWKGAPTTSLVTIATARIISEVLVKNKVNPNVLTVVQRGTDIG